MTSDDIPVPGEALRRHAQTRAAVRPEAWARLNAIKAAIEAGDVRRLGEIATSEVLAREHTHANDLVVTVWVRAVVDELRRRCGWDADEVSMLLARVQGRLLEEVPHVAAGALFDLEREIDRALDNTNDPEATP